MGIFGYELDTTLHNTTCRVVTGQVEFELYWSPICISELVPAGVHLVVKNMGVQEAMLRKTSGCFQSICVQFISQLNAAQKDRMIKTDKVKKLQYTHSLRYV